LLFVFVTRRRFDAAARSDAMSPIRRLLAPGLGCALCVCAGCGGAQPPTRSQADAVAAVRSAREVGAEATPQASYHLALADDAVREADTLIRQGRMEQAQMVLDRAKADAELAIALRREDAVRVDADEAHQRIESLRESDGVAPASTTTRETTTTTTTTETVTP
jgi:hypothetical protein